MPVETSELQEQRRSRSFDNLLYFVSRETARASNELVEFIDALIAWIKEPVGRLPGYDAPSMISPIEHASAFSKRVTSLIDGFIAILDRHDLALKIMERVHYANASYPEEIYRHQHFRYHSLIKLAYFMGIQNAGQHTDIELRKEIERLLQRFGADRIREVTDQVIRESEPATKQVFDSGEGTLLSSAKSLPDKAPALWTGNHLDGDTPATFIMRYYSEYMGKGLTTGTIRKLDPTLAALYSAWRNPKEGPSPEMPEGFNLPSKRQAIDQRDSMLTPEIAAEASKTASRAHRKNQRANSSAQGR